MTRKLLLLVALAVLAAGGFWYIRSTGPTAAPPSASQEDVHVELPPDSPQGRPMLRPPDPSRRFMDFTPEQRVEFARRGSGPGG